MATQSGITIQGQPPVYSDMSIALFMNGYLTVLAEQAKDNNPFLLHHFQEFMEDAEIYSWRAVQDYHAAWLKQIEQGHSSWKDTDKKTKLRRTLVWNHPVPSPISPMRESDLFSLHQL